MAETIYEGHNKVQSGRGVMGVIRGDTAMTEDDDSRARWW
jgi:hypothetical protein